jgi:hypothetical protein
VIGEEVPQADADQPMLFRERADHAAPDSKIIQRAVHANQRRPFCLAYVEIGHVVSVDVKGLHEGSVVGLSIVVMPGHSSQACADCVNLSALPGNQVFLFPLQQSRGWPGLRLAEAASAAQAGQARPYDGKIPGIRVDRNYVQA